MLSTVRVINQKKNELGAGVIIGRVGPVTYILTAAHLLDDTEVVDVHFFSAKSYPKYSEIHKNIRVIARGKDRQPDLAILRVGDYGGDSKGFKIASPKDLPKERKFTAMTTGCDKTIAPSVRKMTVQGVVLGRKNKDTKAEKYFETTEKTIGGQSGGAIFDSQGRLLGLCSLSNNDRGYFCHLEVVREFLSDNAFDMLLK